MCIKNVTNIMGKKIIFLLLMLLSVTTLVYGQGKGQISGVVTSAEDGLPVIGATVSLKGNSSVGTITDIDGRFVLNNLPPGNKTLIISYVGLKTVEINAVPGKPVTVSMKSDTEVLDEVVVVGYGTQKKVNVTGSVSMIGGEKLESRPVQNVSQALQGQIPGLNLTVGSSGGTLDSDMNINIRGAGTIGDGSNSDPLVVIDGMEGDLNTVSANDIASISVLKDAAAASIYGSRAAFGVILITTKSGQSGKPRVSYSGNVRFSSATQLPKMVDSYSFAQYFNRTAQNDGSSAVFSNETMEKILNFQQGKYTDPSTPEYYGVQAGSDGKWSYYQTSFANTDWFDEQYKDFAVSQEHSLNISGGSERLTYMISGSFLDQNGLIAHGSDDFYRYNLSSKISAKLADWVTVNLTSKWVREDYSRPTYLTSLFFHNIARRWPTVPVTDPYGHYTGPSEIIQLEDGGKQTDTKDYYTNQLQVVFEPIKDWHITVEGGMRNYNRRYDYAVLPVYAYDINNEAYAMNWSDDYAAEASRAYSYRYNEDYYSTNIYTDYSRTINGHYFKVMAGFNSELYKTSDLTGSGMNLTSSDVPYLSQVQEDLSLDGGRDHTATAGFFGRINYNWKERYMLEANLRYDGSSRFIGDKTWGLFPSFSAGWNIAREEFFEPLADKIGTLKLRASWGQLGNTNTDAWYPFYQTLSTSTSSSGWVLNGSQHNTASMPSIVSSAMTWETVESWDVGFDFGLLKNRLTGSFDYFNRYTYDMIGPAPTMSSILGTSAPKVNNADMKTQGWELELSWRDRIQDFNYGIRLVLSDYHSTILSYPNSTKSLSTYYDGMEVGEIWGYQTVGIAQSQEEMDAHLANGGTPNWGSNWGAGDIMYANLDGEDGVNSGANTLDNHGDLIKIGNTTPRYNFGITFDASWKGFDLSIFFQGVAKRDYWLSGPYMWGANGGMWQSTCFEEHLDYWRAEDDPLGGNTDAYYPKPYFNTDKNQQTQTRYLQNAAYIRLKNMQLGYTLPKTWTKKAGIENVRIYLSGDNLFTLTGISSVFDPEALGADWGDGKLYPLQRTISVGLNVNF